MVNLLKFWKKETVPETKNETQDKKQDSAFCFNAGNTSLSWTGDYELFKLLVMLGRIYDRAVNNKIDVETLPYYKLLQVINGNFKAALVRDSDISSFLAAAKGLGYKDDMPIYFVIIDTIMSVKSDGTFYFKEKADIFKKGDFKPGIIFWNLKDSIWIENLFENKDIPLYAKGIGNIVIRKTSEKGINTNTSDKDKTESQMSVAEKTTNDTITEIVYWCFNLEPEIEETEDSGSEDKKSSLSKKLKDYETELKEAEANKAAAGPFGNFFGT